ncbi:MAG: dienelactone hydrolase family protein [Alphaproteobacteria bacterium]|nr:dienelactone hydrolase family protein [Alphaproteobacteria bacterium]
MLNGPSFVPSKIQNAVILCHGYGSNGDDLMGLVPYLKQSLPQTGFFCPNGPTPMMYNGFEWFSLSDYNMAPEFVSNDYLDILVQRCEEPSKLLISYIEHIKKNFNLEDKNIILMGFSQGGLLALYTGLTTQNTLSGLIGCSAIPIIFEKNLNASNITKQPSILLTHGTSDEVVPSNGVNLSAHQLSKVGIKPKIFLSEGLGHGIDTPCLNEIISFIQKCCNN